MPKVTLVILPQPIGPPQVERAVVETSMGKLGLEDTVEEVIEAVKKVYELLQPNKEE